MNQGNATNHELSENKKSKKKYGHSPYPSILQNKIISISVASKPTILTSEANINKNESWNQNAHITKKIPMLLEIKPIATKTQLSVNIMYLRKYYSNYLP